MLNKSASDRIAKRILAFPVTVQRQDVWLPCQIHELVCRSGSVFCSHTALGSARNRASQKVSVFHLMCTIVQRPNERTRDGEIIEALLRLLNQHYQVTPQEAFSHYTSVWGHYYVLK